MALPSSVTGSIGVIMTVPNAGELLGRWGLEFEVIKSGANKDLGSFSRALEESERRVLETLIDDTYRQFVDAVVGSRRLGRDSVLVLADGRVMSGARAADDGLIDRTGTLEEAITVAGRMAGLGDDPRIVHPAEPPRSFLEWFVEGSVGNWLGSGGLGALKAPTATPSLRYEWR